ncbi:hypothetical protein WG926_10865 [Tistrella sp. BH-R2-4]|uniref:Uncharacterized protein n=1 Tax=Tistrella arctica TaxID=3133430 RepID=A0ABU9YJ22_9PROT
MLEMHRVRLFARAGGVGGSARPGMGAIVVLGGPDDMSALAEGLDEPATTIAAVMPSLKADAQIEMWRDGIRQPVDGTGLLAAAHVLLGRDGRGPMRFEVDGGVVPVVREADGRLRYRASLSRDLVGDFGGAEVLDAMGVPSGRIADGLPFGLASAGRTTLLLPIADAATLRALRPAFTPLAGWSAGHGAASVLAYAPTDGGVDFAARLFDPLAGRTEEAPGPAVVAALVGALARSGADARLRPVVVSEGRLQGPAVRLYGRAEPVISDVAAGGRTGSRPGAKAQPCLKVWVGGDVRHMGFTAIDRAPQLATSREIGEDWRLGA